VNETRVVNCRVVQCDVYIGRAGHGQSGIFGNPIRPRERCPECGVTHMYGGETLPCYTVYFLRRITNDPEFRRRVEELRGKTLGCFCAPRLRCHGEIIIAWLEGRLVA
jgi:hypothetical protein